METQPRQIKKMDEVYDYNSFYDDFSIKHSPLDLGQKKGKRPIKLSKPLYRNIITNYFDIYMKEVYLLGGTHYFLFTGGLSVCTTNSTVKRIYNGVDNVLHKKNISLVLFWNKRPSELFDKCVTLIKLTGTYNRIPVIERLLRNNFDMNLLPKFEEIKSTFINFKNYVR